MEIWTDKVAWNLGMNGTSHVGWRYCTKYRSAVFSLVRMV
jgi:hypothetical protein